MIAKEYQFEVEIKASEIGKGGAYVIFPYDIREEFGKGRVKVTVYFEQIEYIGSIVNMGVKHDDGSIAYIIGIKKEIRKKLQKDVGDVIKVVVKEAI